MYRPGTFIKWAGAALFLILFALPLTHVLLPLVVATWQLPDPPADEDGDGEPAGDQTVA